MAGCTVGAIHESPLRSGRARLSCDSSGRMDNHQQETVWDTRVIELPHVAVDHWSPAYRVTGEFRRISMFTFLFVFSLFFRGTMRVSAAEEARPGLTLGILYAEMQLGKQRRGQEPGCAKAGVPPALAAEETRVDERLVDPVPLVRVLRVELTELGEKVTHFESQPVGQRTGHEKRFFYRSDGFSVNLLCCIWQREEVGGCLMLFGQWAVVSISAACRTLGGQ
jgi:hypothetical protein